MEQAIRSKKEGQDTAQVFGKILDSEIWSGNIVGLL
jgi:hypothetical protein